MDAVTIVDDGRSIDTLRAILREHGQHYGPQTPQAELLRRVLAIEAENAAPAAHTPGPLLAALWGAAVAVAGEGGAWGALAGLSDFVAPQQSGVSEEEAHEGAFVALADYAQGHGGTDTGTPAEDRAAALHAAAPDLLAALELCRAELAAIWDYEQQNQIDPDEPNSTREALDAAEAAIAKAEGR